MKKEAQEKWSAIMADQNASGLTVEEYCRRNSISTSTFYKNKSRLASLNSPDGSGPAFRKVKVSSSSYLEFYLDGHHIRCHRSDIRLIMEALR